MQKRILAGILRTLAKLTVKKFEPAIVGVTGSVGKTSTKQAIGVVLQASRSTRVSQDSHNNEVGFPLGVLGPLSGEELLLVSKEAPPGGRRVAKLLLWVRVVARSAGALLFGSRRAYPELVVLEYGADRPGDIKKLMDIVRPQVAVVTAVGDVPVHVEFYGSPEAVAREKGRLVEHLPASGFAVLNYDDANVALMGDRTRGHVVTFGFGEGAEVRVTSFEHRMENGRPVGVSFKLGYGGSFVPVRIDGCLGRAVGYAAGAGAGVGISFGMHLVRIAEALGSYEAPRHRMQIVRAVKDVTVVDDSYNASPLSMESAMQTIRGIPAERKVGVLGDMLEIGKYSVDAHEKLGKLAEKVFDVIVTVGPRAKIIAEAARVAGLPRRSIASFDTVEEATPYVQGMVKKGDLVLVKASRAVKLDKLVDALRAAP
jgi:UDP-N-acetylmuramoyl-tripeptide--D-alanyl-D-alanine ligase